LDLDAQARVALEEARAMPGPAKTKALRKAGELRNAADIRGFLFAERGRPCKQ
jgi:energy-coupling factor transporter transmembrane protein EcfT